MSKFPAFILQFLLLVSISSFVFGQESCHGKCRVVCDDEPTFGQNYQMKGAKGSKGEPGEPGERGKSNKQIIAKFIEKVGVLENRINEQSLLIDELSVCENQPIENSSNNASALLRHNDVVSYQCVPGYVVTGENVRRCTRGRLTPSLSLEPFICNMAPKLNCNESNPCINGGKCVTKDDYYQCECPYGFGGINCENVLENCYRFELSSTKQNYADSRHICRSKGGDIVSSFLGDAGVNYHSTIGQFSNFWLGITDEETEGVWKYTNGEEADDLMFSWCVSQEFGAEPDNWSGIEHCAYKNAECMSDQNCYQLRFFALCQIPNGNC